jgi:hypothetical protein
MHRWLARTDDPILLDELLSERLGDLKGAWREIPQVTWVVIGRGRDELRPFTPSFPASSA